MNESDLSDLTTGQLNKKPRLSDAIFFPTDIAPHPFVCIWADVGSGKNTFIEKMIAGCPEESIPRLTVLLITSRKAKVIETLNKYPNKVFGKLCDESNYRDIICEAPLPLGSYQHEITVDDWELTLTQRSVICTNAAIEKYLQYRHDPNDPSTHLWNRFDIIVWDEVHSLGIDSSYQSSPFHVMQLFKKTYQKMRMRSSGKLDPSNGIPYYALFRLLGYLFDCNCNCNGHADHGVVACADQTHHLIVEVTIRLAKILLFSPIQRYGLIIPMMG